jgi:DNA repair protein RadC
MSIHEGHRERMRKRFCQEGLDNFSQHEVLELLLYYVIPRKNTNLVAHDLVKRFGSLAQVLEAPMDELEKVDGIGPNAALLLHLITEVSRVYMVNRAEQQKILRTISECGDYLKSHFIGRKVETVFLLCLDAKCKVLCCNEVGVGSVNSANVPIRRIVEMALAANATTAVLAHNHPSGVALPSQEDRATTRLVAAALSMVDIQLVDHIIVADDDYVSLADDGFRFDECIVI